jgi:simple sugar transport system ATP-binding protein
MMDSVVQMRQITKKFGSLVANERIDFDLRRGEIHCLLGENGAGKTTLMNILYGLWEPNEGDLFVEGRRVRFKSPRDAMNQQIGMVSQHFSLIGTLTVAQNIVLGKIPSKSVFFFDKGAAKNEVLRLAHNLGFKINPDRKVEDLSVGEQQKVEIVKALYHNAKIVILDEPTAVLTPQESSELFDLLRRMTKEGRSAVLITHKLDEALKSDFVTVLRNGRVILSKVTNTTTKDELAEAMFGKRLSRPDHGTAISESRRSVLEIENVSTAGTVSDCLKDISFNVCEGEIFGVAGVAGNGQKTLVDAIMGISKVTKGRVLMKGSDITNGSPRSCRTMKIGCIPEERKKSAVFHGMSVAENLILGRESKRPFARAILLIYSVVCKFASRIVQLFDIKTPTIHIPVQHLSGGNLQKVILARELTLDPELIVASQPTRGLDAKTVDFIYEKLREEKEKGKAILLISYDLDEILELSDTIGVLYEGRMQVVHKKEIEPNEIGRMMVGTKK